MKILNALQDLEHNALDLGHVQIHLDVYQTLQVMLEVLEYQVKAPTILVLLTLYKIHYLKCYLSIARWPRV